MELNFTQSDIEMVGSISNLGAYSALEGGFLFDAFGPFVAGTAGLVLMALGYALMWAGACKYIPHSYGMIGMYSFLWNHGTSFIGRQGDGIFAHLLGCFAWPLCYTGCPTTTHALD